MKHLYSLIALLALVSCQDSLVQDEIKSPVEMTDLKSNEEYAILIAEHAASAFYGESRVSRVVTSSKAVTPIYSNVTSRTDDETPSLYAVDYDDNQGFAIISAENTNDKVLGIFETGSYEDAIENPSFDYYIERAANYVKIIAPVDSNETVIEGTIVDMKEDRSKKISPKISTEWGQRYPYGLYCPNGVSGCVNTAIAQIMSYYKYPESIKLTYSGASQDSISLVWSEILKHKKSNDYYSDGSDLSCCGSSDAHNMIASLIREIGERTYSTYKTGDTISTQSKLAQIPYAIKSFGLNISSFLAYAAGVEYDELAKGVLLVYGSHGNSAHMWVVDGYRRIYTILKVKTSTGETTKVADNPNYAHVNWGWNGLSNGYYLSSVFDTSRELYADDNCPMSSARYVYNENLKYYVVSH
jgi:hypothetical protein